MAKRDYDRSLTPDELKVLKALASGARTAVIAQRLEWRPGQVSRATYRIFNKLGANSRLEAVMFAMHEGIL